MSTSDNIRRFRRQAGMSQQELGRRLGVSGSMVGQWECGTRSPKYETVCHIALVLGVSANELFASSDVSPLDDSADECEYVGMLRHYQEDLPDDALLDEAIATLESYFSHMDKAALLHFSRPLAIAYLALKHEQGERVEPSHWTRDKECYSCGELALYNGNEELVPSRFCPHCGAPMDNHK